MGISPSAPNAGRPPYALSICTRLGGKKKIKNRIRRRASKSDRRPPLRRAIFTLVLNDVTLGDAGHGTWPSTIMSLTAASVGLLLIESMIGFTPPVRRGMGPQHTFYTAKRYVLGSLLTGGAPARELSHYSEHSLVGFLFVFFHNS